MVVKDIGDSSVSVDFTAYEAAEIRARANALGLEPTAFVRGILRDFLALPDPNYVPEKRPLRVVLGGSGRGDGRASAASALGIGPRDLRAALGQSHVETVAASPGLGSGPPLLVVGWQAARALRLQAGEGWAETPYGRVLVVLRSSPEETKRAARLALLGGPAEFLPSGVREG